MPNFRTRLTVAAAALVIGALGALGLTSVAAPATAPMHYHGTPAAMYHHGHAPAKMAMYHHGRKVLSRATLVMYHHGRHPGGTRA